MSLRMMKTDLVEPGALRVEDGIVDDDLPAGPDGVDLLQAAISAADTGRHHYQCCLRHAHAPFASGHGTAEGPNGQVRVGWALEV